MHSPSFLPASSGAVDPRSGLPILSIPTPHKPHFGMLDGTLIHCFVPDVTSVRADGLRDARVVVVSDQCLYTCMPDGAIVRCVPTSRVSSAILCSPEPCILTLRVLPPEYDVWLLFPSRERRDDVVRVLSTTMWVFAGCNLNVRTVATQEQLRAALSLSRPSEWQLRIEPIKSVAVLDELLAEYHRKDRELREAVEAELCKVKQRLALDVEARRSRLWDDVVECLAAAPEEGGHCRRCDDVLVALQDGSDVVASLTDALRQKDQELTTMRILYKDTFRRHAAEVAALRHQVQQLEARVDAQQQQQQQIGRRDTSTYKYGAGTTGSPTCTPIHQSPAASGSRDLRSMTPEHIVAALTQQQKTWEM
eukprot:PhM_4_TR8373/c0_g2_i1/m.66032